VTPGISQQEPAEDSLLASLQGKEQAAFSEQYLLANVKKFYVQFLILLLYMITKT